MVAHDRKFINRMRSAVAKARKGGTLAAPAACESCGAAERLVLHHWSYEEAHWLDVIPLCRRCHARVHTGALPEPRTGRMYPRRIGGASVAWANDSAAEFAVLQVLWAAKGHPPFMPKERFNAVREALMSKGVGEWLRRNEDRSSQSWLQLLCHVYPGKYDSILRSLESNPLHQE